MESIKKSASKSFMSLSGVGRHNILLKVFDLNGMGVIPLSLTLISWFFKSNLLVHQVTIYLKSNANSSTHMDFTILDVQTLFQILSSWGSWKCHLYTMDQWKYLQSWASDLTMYPQKGSFFFFFSILFHFQCTWVSMNIMCITLIFSWFVSW